VPSGKTCAITYSAVIPTSPTGLSAAFNLSNIGARIITVLTSNTAFTGAHIVYIKAVTPLGTTTTFKKTLTVTIVDPCENPATVTPPYTAKAVSYLIAAPTLTVAWPAFGYTTVLDGTTGGATHTCALTYIATLPTTPSGIAGAFTVTNVPTGKHFTVSTTTVTFIGARTVVIHAKTPKGVKITTANSFITYTITIVANPCEPPATVTPGATTGTAAYTIGSTAPTSIIWADFAYTTSPAN